MSLGAFALLFGALPLKKPRDKVPPYGVWFVEIGAGAFRGRPHCAPAALLASEAKLAEFRGLFASRGITISTLSCYGNPLHPAAAIGAVHTAELKECVRLSATLGIGIVNCFAGMPEGAAGDRTPNWVTCPWPP